LMDDHILRRKRTNIFRIRMIPGVGDLVREAVIARSLQIAV
jgi:hypothetical protein